MKQVLLKFFIITCFLLFYNSAIAQLAKCKGKYFGNIIAYSIPSNYGTYWNQVTSENGSKWGSIEGNQGVYNWGNSDLAYNWAKNNNGSFKFHALAWGAQTPEYARTGSAASITTGIHNFIKACSAHYAPMGGLPFIDVLNEPVNTPMPGNMKAALTAGYRAEPANAGDLNNQYGWAIWCFQLARKYFPNSTLLINEYNVEMNWNNCRAPYIAMTNAIKNAPNLTDGRKNLIDGVGLQCHGIGGLSATNFRACIDEIWTKTGIPIHITEFDQTADPNEEKQRAVYASLIPIAWEHPHVAGITLWGYIQGSTWVGGNGAAGPGGTDTGLLYKSSYTSNPLGERPAMTWLKSYLAGRPSLSCCPLPAPFAACNGSNAPTVSITTPATNASFTAPATINITATASDVDGTISKVEFFNGTTKLGEDLTSPYTYSWTNISAGTYTITAVATDNSGNKTTSAAVTIKVNVPQGPYNGTVHLIPGTIQAEAFDVGGNGFAYLDNTPGSAVTPVVNFRTNEDVDIENCTDAGGGYNIGWATAGEWLEYTVNVQTAGVYSMDLRAACEGDGRTMSVSMDGTNISSNVAIPNTSGWQVWQTVTVNNIALTAGQKIMRITIGATDYVNLNSVTFRLNSPPTATITATGATTFCVGGSLVLNASTGAGYTYQWKRDGSNIVNATSSSYTATQSGSYTVSVSANSQTATSTAIDVTVSSLPVITPHIQINAGAWAQQSAAQLCASGTVVLGPQPVSATGWSWTGPNGFTSSMREISLTNISFNQGGIYTATYTSNGCSSTQAFNITVNNLPDAPIVTSPVTYCQSASAIQLTSSGTNRKWYTVESGGTSSDIAPTPSTTTAGSTSYYVSQTMNGCESSRATIAVTVNAIPAVPSVTSPVSYCQNASATQLTAIGTNLKWYTVANGGTSSGSAPTPSTASVGTSSQYVSQGVNGCESARAMISITITALPDAEITASGPTTFVQGGSVTLIANTGAGLSYTWFNGTMQVGTGASYIATSTGSYVVEVTNTSGCKATSSATNVSANGNQPSVISIVSPVSNSTVNGPITFTVTVSDPDGGITSVEYLDGTTVIGTSTSSPYSFTWDNPTPGDHVITVRVTDSNGGVTTSNPVTVTSGVSTGIHAATEMQGLVYPNPASGEMTIETAMDLTNAKVTVINVLGEEVQLPSLANGIGVSIDVSNLAEGTYLLTVRQENNVLRKKITVIR